MNALRWTGYLGNFVALLISSSFAWAGPPIDKSGYLTDDRGNFVRNSYGDCWRTGFWTPELAVAECDPGLVKMREESKELQPSPAIAPSTPPAAAPSAAPFTVSSPASIAASAAPSTAPAAASSVTPFIAPAAGPALVPAKPAAVPEKAMAATLRAEALFDFDKADLKPEGQKDLDEKIINGIKMHSGAKMLLVTGHTDFIGAENYNQELSERRANAVREHLIRNGIDAKHIKVTGKGESERNPEANTRQTCKDMKGKKLIACLHLDRRVTVAPEN